MEDNFGLLNNGFYSVSNGYHIISDAYKNGIIDKEILKMALQEKEISVTEYCEILNTRLFSLKATSEQLKDLHGK